MSNTAPQEYCFSCIPVLEFLKGRKWDPILENYLMALRPSSVEILRDDWFVTADASSWRVRVFLKDGIVDHITQEVCVGAHGIRYGHDLEQYLRHGKLPTQEEIEKARQPGEHVGIGVFNPRGLKRVNIETGRGPQETQ